MNKYRRHFSRLSLSCFLCCWFLQSAAAEASPASARGAIYPAQSSTIIFSHAAHQSTSCLNCHAGIEQSASPQGKFFPKEKICARCHKDLVRQELTERVTSRSECSKCHRGYEKFTVAPRFEYQPARLRFSHRAHQQRSVPCGQCHFLEGKSTEITLPMMSQCQACHRQQKAPQRCAVCHLTNKDGRLITDWSPQKLKPLRLDDPAAHNSLFSQEHRAIAQTNRRYCDNCHQAKDCSRCHLGSVRPLNIHLGDYVTRHAADARRNSPRCDSCHRSTQFCQSCHQRVGVGQERSGQGFKPATVRSYHPAGFYDFPPGPTHHQFSARRQLSNCSSCHRESTCLRCHGTRARAKGGISPHPPGFATSRQCASMSSRNQRVCLKCHTPGDTKMKCQ